MMMMNKKGFEKAEFFGFFFFFPFLICFAVFFCSGFGETARKMARRKKEKSETERVRA